MSDEIETHPRDFLRRFGGRERPTVKEEPVKEVELSLGLYLGGGGGGSFSGDNKGLVRSSSLYTFPKEEEEVEDEAVFGREFPAMSSAHTLIRACSLPVQTGDVQRKREELQCLRRLEAKRKREERRSLRLKAEENGTGGATDATSSSSSSIPRRRRRRDYDYGLVQGLDNISRCSAKKTSPPLPAKQSSPLARLPAGKIGMPCVSAKGDGPNGKRIDGFLYKYSKGEEVRIMCVCHGSFLSPTEFVKHAGGGDVEFPLRHIVVYPSPQTFL